MSMKKILVAAVLVAAGLNGAEAQSRRSTAGSAARSTKTGSNGARVQVVDSAAGSSDMSMAKLTEMANLVFGRPYGDPTPPCLGYQEFQHGVLGLVKPDTDEDGQITKEGWFKIFKAFGLKPYQFNGPVHKQGLCWMMMTSTENCNSFTDMAAKDCHQAMYKYNNNK
jgi:hypothetical protein